MSADGHAPTCPLVCCTSADDPAVLGVPMPTWEQIEKVIDRRYVSNPATRARIADSVLALINGTER